MRKELNFRPAWIGTERLLTHCVILRDILSRMSPETGVFLRWQEVSSGFCLEKWFLRKTLLIYVQCPEHEEKGFRNLARPKCFASQRQKCLSVRVYHLSWTFPFRYARLRETSRSDVAGGSDSYWCRYRNYSLEYVTGFQFTIWVEDSDRYLMLALTATTFFILDNPNILSKLRKELAATMPNRYEKPSCRELEALPYLISFLKHEYFRPMRWFE